jgi:hypothetical protein
VLIFQICGRFVKAGPSTTLRSAQDDRFLLVHAGVIDISTKAILERFTSFPISVPSNTEEYFLNRSVLQNQTQRNTVTGRERQQKEKVV